MRSPATLAVLASLLLTGAVACEEARFGGRRPNVVLVSVQSLRPDALEPYGGPVATPTFQRLADEGVLFENAYASAPATGPSEASLLTGLRVLQHGVAADAMTLAARHRTLAEDFHDHGYATAAFVSSWVLDPRFGFGQGFDLYDAELTEAEADVGRGARHASPAAARAGPPKPRRAAVATTLAAGSWLREAPEPFFLFVHYADPHPPYTPPRSFASRVAGLDFDVSRRSAPGLSPRALLGLARGYQAEVLYVDDALAELVAMVDARSESRDTLLVVTAAHGASLGDHGTVERGTGLYAEQLQVPLFFRWPERLPARKRVRTPLSLRSVAPTIGALTFVGGPASREARTLAASLRAGREPPQRPVFAQGKSNPAVTPPSGTLPAADFAVRLGRWRLIRGHERPPQLYDLELDPGEREDVAARHPEVTAELAKMVDELVWRSPSRIAGLPQNR